MEYWTAKPHAEQKYAILGKYLAACGNFARKYRNFAYIDSHGGSGLIEMEDNAPLFSPGLRQTPGSPLIAARAIQAWSKHSQFPCHVIEIHPGRYATLRQSTAAYPWIKTHHGDCNVLLPDILKATATGAFVLCFVDPDGLVYSGPGSGAGIPQFSWSTMEQIASREKVELLLNFPLEAILRTTGYYQKRSDQSAAQAMAVHLTDFYGRESWQRLHGKRQFLDCYLDRLRKLNFPYLGAYYVNRGGLPLYYLIYGTRNSVGAKIMRDVMRGEWETVHSIWAAEAAQVGLDHPLQGFIFDNEGLLTQGDYPPNWEEIAQVVKEEAKWKCQECGAPHSSDSQTGHVLTVHHIDGNPANCARENLIALCQRCHLQAQADLRTGSMSGGDADQLPLFSDYDAE